MIQNHAFRYQLIRGILTGILTVMATIAIFVWIIFSYKLYKQIYLINILAAAVWKFWQVWFNFGCFQYISALKSIKSPRNPLKESQNYQNITMCHLLYSSPTLDQVHKRNRPILKLSQKSLFIFLVKISLVTSK